MKLLSTLGRECCLPLALAATSALTAGACTRIGALHSVVFGGFASVSLASRIDDAQPTLIISADAGSRGGKVVQPPREMGDGRVAIIQDPVGAACALYQSIPKD